MREAQEPEIQAGGGTQPRQAYNTTGAQTQDDERTMTSGDAGTTLTTGSNTKKNTVSHGTDEIMDVETTTEAPESPLAIDRHDTTTAALQDQPMTTSNTHQQNDTSSSLRTSTETLPKSTTCAFTLHTTLGPNNTSTATHTPPLDDTMVQAVDNLQISYTTNNQSTTTHATHTSQPWTLVTTKNAPMTKPPPSGTTTSRMNTSHEYGLAFERTTKGINWSTADLLLILQTVQAHDPKATLSSADNKTRPTPLVTAIIKKAQKDIPWFTKFTAMKTMTWGKPSDGTTKIVFSFWLTSTIIKKDLAQLRMDSDFTEMLKGTNTYMKVTKLLEPPHSKIVGYFLGKDIIHTNTSKAQIMSKYTSVMYLH